MLIAAAGNAGAKSTPAVPRRRSPLVIAVERGDRRRTNKLFTGRHRGKVHLGGGARGRHPGARRRRTLTGSPPAPRWPPPTGVSGISGTPARGAIPSSTPADVRRILQASAQAARRRRARRQFRLRPHRPAQGAADGRSPHRGHDAHAYAYAAAGASQSWAGAHWSAWSPALRQRPLGRPRCAWLIC